MEIKNLICTGHACPSQWEGHTEKNESIYIRYRYGRLTIELSKPNGTITDAINSGNIIYSKLLGNELDGVITEEEVMKIIEGL